MVRYGFAGELGRWAPYVSNLGSVRGKIPRLIIGGDEVMPLGPLGFEPATQMGTLVLIHSLRARTVSLARLLA